MGDLVQLNDVLYAMADSVMETVPKPFNPVLKFQDKKINIKIGGKPPREIFYRKTLTFLTKLPPPVQPKLCSCQYLCDGDPAEIKCHSCSIYTPTNAAFYCQRCFDGRHPWYRVAHIFSTIEHDESIEHTMKVAHRISEAIRYEKEGQELLSGLQREKERVAYIADDEKVDNQLREFGRRAIALEDHIEELRQKLRVDMEVGVRRKSLVMNQQMHDRWVKRLSVHMDQTAAISETHKNNLQEALAAAQKILESEGDSPPKLVPDIPVLEEIMILPKSRSIRGSIVASVSLPSVLEKIATMQTELNSNTSAATADAVDRSNTTTGNMNIVLEESPESSPVIISSNIEEVSPEEDTIMERAPLLDKTEENYSINKIVPLSESNMINNFHQQPGPPPMIDLALQLREKYKFISNVDTYVTHIQAIFRGYMGRKMVSDMMMLRLLRVWSPTYGREYYYDRVTGQSAWILPKLVMRQFIDDMEYVTEDSQYLIWVCKRYAMKKDKGNRNALQILQGFGRCILARKRIIRKAIERYRRVWDSESGTFYYADILTGDTSWQKIGVFLSVEPPVYTPDSKKKGRKHGSSNNGSNRSSRAGSSTNSYSEPAIDDNERRISPRINRLLTSSSSQQL